MHQPAASCIVITPNPLGSGYTVTTYEGGSWTGKRQSAIPADTLEDAQAYARQLAATAGGGYQIIEETRLNWPLYMPEEV